MPGPIHIGEESIGIQVGPRAGQCHDLSLVPRTLWSPCGARDFVRWDDDSYGVAIRLKHTGFSAGANFVSDLPDIWLVSQRDPSQASRHCSHLRPAYQL